MKLRADWLGLAWLAIGVCVVSVSAADQPPSPWTAVGVWDDGRISVWGRTYDFSSGPLPCAIQSAAEAVLAAPVRLVLDGGEREIRWDRAIIEKKTSAAVSLSALGTSPGIRWEAAVEVSYDGLIWTVLSARATTPEAVIDRLTLDVPMPASETEIFSHHFVATEAIRGAWRSHFLGHPERLWDAGATPEGGWSGEFTPQLWLGSYRRGLALLAETPQSWRVPFDGDIMAVLPPREGRSGMRAELVGMCFSPGDRWTVEFGLMATPVRPPTSRPELYRITQTGGNSLENHIRQYAPENFEESKLKLIAEDGGRIVLLWNNWTNLWGFPGMSDPAYRDFMHRFIDYAHRLGLKVIPYLGALAQLPDNHPDFSELRDKFILCPREYHRNPFIEGVGNYRVVPTPDFIRWYVEQLTRLVREFGIDGVYLDTIAKPDQPLQKEHVVYSWRAWREFYERIYRVFHGDVIDGGYVYFHDSEPNIFMLNAFADCRLSGEMQYYCAAARSEVIPVLPDLKNRMSPQRFFAWTSGCPLGDVPTYWCAKSPWATSYSVGQGKVRSSFQCGEMVHPQEIFGLGALFRVYPNEQHSFRRPDAPYYEQRLCWWRMEERILGDDPLWLPLWEAGRYIRLGGDDHIQAAGYLVPGKRLLVHVMNFEAKPKQLQVKLLPTTGLDNCRLAVVDHLAAPGSAVTPGTGTLDVSLAPNGFLRALLQPHSK